MEGANEIFAGFLGGFLLGLHISDFAMPIGLILWLIILWIPLKGIDRDDSISGLTYLAFSAFTAAVLIIIMPSHLDRDPGFIADFRILAMVTVIGVFRWKWTKLFGNIEKKPEKAK